MITQTEDDYRVTKNTKETKMIMETEHDYKKLKMITEKLNYNNRN